MNKFFGDLGHCVFWTVCNGNCGIDVMAMMLERPQNDCTRAWIRKELFDFGMENRNEQWLRDMVVVFQDQKVKASRLYRSCNLDGLRLQTVPQHDDVEGDEKTEGGAHVAVTIFFEALQRRTGVTDVGVLMSMAVAMPDALQQEQIRAHAAAAALGDTRIVVRPWLAEDHLKVFQRSGECVRSCGWQRGNRLPRHSIVSLKRSLTWPADTTEKWQRAGVTKWWNATRRLGRTQL